MLKKFNLNNKIRFKPTEHGQKVMMHKMHPSEFIEMAKTEEDGYFELQFAEFMNVFGERMYLGAMPVVDFNIKIKEKDIEDIK